MNPAIFRRLTTALFVYAFIGLFAQSADAQVTGNWATTALSRFDVTAIKAPGLVPQHTVSIADGRYGFAVNGSFSAGEITGQWRQKNSTYVINPDRLTLENAYRLALENTPGLVVYKVQLLNSKLQGQQLDNGIWGSERYIYKIDISLQGRRQQLRIAMALNVAGHRPPTVPANAAAAAPQADLMATAAAVVVAYLNQH
ncbi:MAG: hypothetical protein HOP34_14165 [Methylococcaceae bacterium]|nr:hypothetical protein [Methylococcaceae bacterium]